MNTATLDSRVPATHEAFETPSKAKLWTARVLIGLPALFIAVNAVLKFVATPLAAEAAERIGFHASTLPYLGVIELVIVALLYIRRARVFGAVLFSAYLGGAVATHVRLGDPLFDVVFPIFFAALVWAGLYLCDERVRALSPFRK
jgi:hypothetical protein